MIQHLAYRDVAESQEVVLHGLEVLGIIGLLQLCLVHRLVSVEALPLRNEFLAVRLFAAPRCIGDVSHCCGVRSFWAFWVIKLPVIVQFVGKFAYAAERVDELEGF